MKVDSVPYISQVLLATFYLWFAVEVAEVATTVSLLGAQHKKGIVWKTSRHACLLFPWVRHLAGRFRLYVADRWLTRTLPGYSCEVAHPTYHKRRLLGTHQW